MKKQLNGTAVNKHAHENNRGMRLLKAKMIYLEGDPRLFRSLGKFLCECGEQMKAGTPFHRHFRDYHPGWTPNVIDVVADRFEQDVTKTRKRRTKKP